MRVCVCPLTVFVLLGLPGTYYLFPSYYHTNVESEVLSSEVQLAIVEHSTQVATDISADPFVYTTNWPSAINRANDDYFFVYWTGLVYVPVTGSYTFRLRSSQGSALYLDGIGIMAIGGTTGIQPWVATQSIGAGMHAITITFFQNNAALDGSGPLHLELAAQVPGSSIFQLFNNSFLYDGVCSGRCFCECCFVQLF